MSVVEDVLRRKNALLVVVVAEGDWGGRDGTLDEV